MVFDANADIVNISSLPIGGGDFTVEIYVKMDSVSSYPNIYEVDDGTYNFILYGHDSIPSVYAKYEVAGDVNLSANYTDGNWLGQFRHYTTTHSYASASSTTVVYYVDGNIEGTGTTGNSLSSPSTVVLSNATNPSFRGTIAYFRIWDGTALSATDVARLYAHRNAIGPGLQIHSNNELALGITQNTLSMPRYNLVMEARSPFPGLSVGPTYAWEFRDNTGTDVVYDWASGVAATPSGGASSSSEGMAFSANTDYLDAGTITLSGVAYSVEAYVNRSSTSTYDFIYDLVGDESRLYLSNTANQIGVWYDGTAAAARYTPSNSGYYTASKWIHIVSTITDSGDICIYVDNAKATSSSVGLSAKTDIVFTIGNDADRNGTNVFNGTIAYFRIWNGTALSASDVAILYAGRDIKGYNGYDFNVCGKSALSVAPSAAEVAGSLSVGGAVGIGTSSPESALHVAGVIDTSPTVAGLHMGMAGSDATITINTVHNANCYLDFASDNGSSLGRIDYATSANLMRFYTNGITSSQERMQISSAGYVGIGTTSPESALQVVGPSHNSIATIPSTKGIHMGLNNNNATIKITSAASTNNHDLDFTHAGSSYDYRGKIRYFGATDTLGFYTGGAAKMFLNSTGLGIGANPPDCPLHVDGTEAFGSSLGGTYYRITTNAYANQSADRPLMCNIEGRTGVSELVVYSDERIKKNIVDLSDNEALETLRLIEPKKYEYVDQILRTNNTVYGYIAQQIKEVLPYAVQEIRNKVVPNVYSYADISSELVYTKASDISAVSIVGISTLYVDVSNVNTSAEVSMNVVMVEQSDISQNAVFSEAELEDGTKVHKLTFNDGYNTSSLHESSDILRVMDASNQEYHITITNIETSYRVEIDEDLSSLVNAQGELFVAGQQVPQNVYKLVFSTFDTATLDASSTTLKLVDASDATQYVSIASVLDSSTLQIDDDLQYMVPDSSNQLFVYGQKVSKSVSNLTFDASYNVRSISSNAVSLKVIDANAQEQYVNVHTKESVSNRLVLDEDISGKISYGASGELFVQGQKIQTTKHILNIQNYDTANLDASSTTLCLYDYDDAKHEVSIVSVIDGSNVEISEDPTSFAHEGQVFVYGQKVDDFHTLSKEYINVVTLSAVQELDRALTKVTEEKDELQTKYDALEARVLALEGASST
jgi:hypothetical protein